MKKVICLSFGILLLNTSSACGMNAANNESNRVFYLFGEGARATLRLRGRDASTLPSTVRTETIFEPISFDKINGRSHDQKVADAEYERGNMFVAFLRDEGNITPEEARRFEYTLRVQRYGHISSFSGFEESSRQLKELLRNETYQRKFADFEHEQVTRSETAEEEAELVPAAKRRNTRD